MFVETLLESGVARQPSRGWATTASFSMQFLALAVLVALPSVYPEMMSVHRTPPVSVPIFSAPPPPSQTQPPQRESGSTTAELAIPVIKVPDATLTFGRKTQEQADPGPAPQPTGLNPLGRSAGIPNGFYIAPPRPLAHAEPLKLSHMDPGSLMHSVQPVYPKIAVISRIEGQVVLTAIISKTGEIESLQTVSGHPVLASAAKDAVRQWRYHPYILNGEPIEVETQITVNFKLGN